MISLYRVQKIHLTHILTAFFQKSNTIYFYFAKYNNCKLHFYRTNNKLKIVCIKIIIAL